MIRSLTGSLYSALYSATSRRTSLSAFSSQLSAVLLSAFFLTSCQQELQEPISEPSLVDVTINLSGLDITSSEVLTRASDKSVTEAQITNIDLKVFNAEGNAVETVSQTSSDANFGSLSMKLPVGTYTFVAVANDANAASTITSSTEATAPENAIIYSCSQSETISGNTTQTVSLDMGTRKNTCFRIKITDATPSDVDAIQLIIAPTATAPTAITFSPETGFTSSSWKYEKTYTKADYSLTTFTNKNLAYCFLLPSAETQLDVTINALSAEDTQTHQRTVLYTRTLQGVTFKQATQTTATGTFFSSQSIGSLLFDTTITNSNISLD